MLVFSMENLPYAFKLKTFKFSDAYRLLQIKLNGLQLISETEPELKRK